MTLSIPLPADLEKQLQQAIKMGWIDNKASFGRRALEKELENLAVQAVLDAEKEPSLEGDLDELAKK
ncbi:hypothetical protein IPJ72_05520 [Candidatus Peregrinibacteria bacterium]|nr:MAG: hypothetical protein IPJ72_05520 [Candidatus Peregrinibacteria bacterium]